MPEECRNQNPERAYDCLYRCLIANDEPMQLMVIEALFEKTGFAVETAINGYEAFEKF